MKITLWVIALVAIATLQGQDHRVVTPSPEGYTAYMLRHGTRRMEQDIIVIARRADGAEMKGTNMLSMIGYPIHDEHLQPVRDVDYRYITYPNGTHRSVNDPVQWVQTMAHGDPQRALSGGQYLPANHCVIERVTPPYEFVGYEEVKGVQLAHVKQVRIDTDGHKVVQENWYWEEANCRMLQFHDAYFNAKGEPDGETWNDLIRIENSAPNAKLFAIPSNYQEGSVIDLEKKILKYKLGEKYPKVAPQCYLNYIHSDDPYTAQDKSALGVALKIK